MDILLVILISFAAGIGIAKLFPYIKDFKITSEEKEQVEEILMDTSKYIIKLIQANGESDLISKFSNMVIEELEKKNIKDIKKENVELIIKILTNKMDDYFKKGA